MNPKSQFELLSPALPERCIEPWAGKKFCLYIVFLHRGGNSGAKEEGFYSRLNSRVKHKEAKDRFQWCCVNCTVGNS